MRSKCWSSFRGLNSFIGAEGENLNPENSEKLSRWYPFSLLEDVEIGGRVEVLEDEPLSTLIPAKSLTRILLSGGGRREGRALKAELRRMEGAPL